MLKKLFIVLIACCCLTVIAKAQFITVSSITPTGKLAECNSAYGLPTVTCKFLGGPGSTLTGGVLVCNNVCDTTQVEITLENLRWNKGVDINWVHGIYFPGNPGLTLESTSLGPLGWVYTPTGCTGSCPAPGGGITGGPGFYFAGPGDGCCIGGGSTPSPCDNWGDGTYGCAVPLSFTFIVRICNSAITGSTYNLDIKVDCDGNTGCWVTGNSQVNQLSFKLATAPCGPIYSPAPAATTVRSCATGTPNYTATLTAGCGNGSTVTWWNAATGGTQIGSGSPFVYDPPGSACPAGTTLYAACCPAGNVCVNRQPFTISGTCPAAISITNIALTQPTCASPAGAINGVTVAASTGVVTYTLTPGGSNTTGVFSGLNGTNYTLTASDASGCSASTNVVFTSSPGGGAPTVITPLNYCRGFAAPQLTAIGVNLKWYTAAVGGTGTATAPVPSTAIAGTTLYYVSQNPGGLCESPRAVITVVVAPQPAPPGVVTPVNICQNASATPLTATGSGLLWYTALSGGTGNSASPLPSTLLTGSTAHYVTQTTGGCESPRALITVNVTSLPSGPVVSSPVIYCQNATTTALTAGGSNLLWYTTSTGGTGSATAPVPSALLAGTTTYYVTQTVGACESPRVAIVVTVNTRPVAPAVVTPVSYCRGVGAVPLSASGSGLLWYTVSTGGVGSPIAPIPSTAIVGTTIYYVSQTTGGCESPRAAINVAVNAVPSAPTAATPISYCLNAGPSALSAGGVGLLWYNNASGGIGSSSAPVPQTASAGTTLYYVSQTVGNCESPRTAITVNVINPPAAPNVNTPAPYCLNAPATQLSAGGSNLLWYTGAAGGTGSPTAPIPSTVSAGSFNYYVSQTVNGCESPRAVLIVTVNGIPLSPAAASLINYCAGASASPLSATGSTLLWYTNATGGIGSSVAPTPSTASAGSYGYYVSQTISGCESPRSVITVIVSPVPTSPSVISPVNLCQNTPASALSAGGTNLLWYTSAVGGTGSTTAPIPNTSVVGTTFYYVSQSVGLCESPRAVISVIIKTIPPAPGTISPVVYCQNTSATALTATGTGLLWYNSSIGGTALPAPPVPSTATPGSTIYFVSQTVNGCESPRAAVTVTINPTPSAPAVASPLNYCSGTPAAQLSATGSNLLWYTNATGGIGNSVAPTPSTASAGTYGYYVSQTISGCESPRSVITVNVSPVPPSPLVISPVDLCQNTPASALSAGGTNLLWYTSAVGGTGSTTAPIPNTSVVGTTFYYVSQSAGLCESPRAVISVIIKTIPPAPGTISPVGYCQNTSAAALTATGTGLLWFNSSIGGTALPAPPVPSTATPGSTIYFVSQTVNGCEGPRSIVTVTINATPPAPAVASPLNYCSGTPAAPLSAVGSNLLWYTNATGGIGSSVAPTPSTASAGSYGYYVSQTISGCESPRSVITVNVSPVPASPSVITPVSFCQNEAASALSAGGTTLLWYTAAIGGTGSSTAPVPNTSVAGTTAYYATQSVGLCESPRAAISVIIKTIPPAPGTISPVVYCQNTSATALTATGTGLRWYNSSIGGTAFPATPVPSTATPGSTIYFVSQTVNGCESPRAAVTVNITPGTPAPAVSSDIYYCVNETASALSATGSSLLWYSSFTGGIGSATAPVPSTTIAGTTAYYVSQTLNSCESGRASVLVHVQARPLAPVVSPTVNYCVGATTTPLTASGVNLLWYNASSGGTGSLAAPTPSSLSAGTTQYFVSQSSGTCESPRAQITVTVNAVPAAPPISSPISYCQNAAASPLTAAGTNLLWYSTLIGGTGSPAAPTPSTAVPGTYTYFVSQSSGNCESMRATISVIVNPAPSAPAVISPQNYCQYAPAAPLTASGTNLLWYTSATGGTGVTTAPAPATSNAGAFTYYVSQTLLNCEGPRAVIIVNVTSAPLSPGVVSPIIYCAGTAAAQLTAAGINLLWYTSSSGGAGNTLAPTPSTTVAGTTSHFVSQSTGGCESPRAVINVLVNPLPAAPTVTSPISYCQNETAASLTASGTNLLWYNAVIGGSGSPLAPVPSTLTAGTEAFYVSQTNNACEGPRALITVTVNPRPSAPAVVSPVEYCPGDQATTLTATGTNLLWYPTATGGTGSASTPLPSVATPGSTSYFVSQTTGSCEGPRAQIIVNVNNVLTVNIGTDVDLCQGDTAHMNPLVNQAGAAYQWTAINASNSSILDRNLKNAALFPLDTTQYILRATLRGCFASDTVRVNVKWKPIAKAGNNVPICINDSVFLSGSATHTSGPITSFTWTPADSLRTPNAAQTWAHPAKSTLYKLTVSTTIADYGCTFISHDSLMVYVQPAVRAFAGNDTIAVKNSKHQLRASGGAKFLWSSPTAVFSNPAAQNPTVVLANDANIFLRVEDAIGCFGLDSLFVKVYEGPTYYVPNAFSPNGDGLNDVFRVIPAGIATTDYFRVFNRYGQLVFETSQWLKGWDGTWKGKAAEGGSYVWMLKGRDKNNLPIEMKGTVILIR